MPIDDGDAFALQCEENWQFDDVDADGFFVQAAHFELDANLLGDIFGATHLRRHGAAQHGDSGTRPFAKPRAIELMVLGGRTKIPQNGLVILRQQGEAIGFVLRPGADVGGGQIAHVVHVETEDRAHLRLR